MKSIAIIKKHAISIVLTLLICAALMFLSIQIFQDYAILLFLATPFLIGFLPPLLTHKKKNLPWKECRNLGYYTLIISNLLLLVFAIEGMICIVMALPLLFLCSYIGSSVAYLFIKENYESEKKFVAIFTLIVASSSTAFDSLSDDKTILKPVVTSIHINASAQEVWDNIISFNEIPPPTEFIFKTGIAYPINARLEKTDAGYIRYCEFTTGDFVEPITTWDEPNLLAFDVIEQPEPMTELSPYNIHPPHLYGYFSSHKGQFKLTPISENETILEGTTFYSSKYFPAIYWDIYIEYILHKIHERALGHIKNTSESK